MAGDFLAALDVAIEGATPAERAGLVVQLAARLATLGAGLVSIGESPAPSADDNLDVRDAARRLGVSVPYAYRHEWPGITRREGRKLIFSAKGIAKYLERAQGRRA